MVSNVEVFRFADGDFSAAALINRPPVVGTIANRDGTEDDATFSIDLLQGASDPDANALSVTGLTIKATDGSGNSVSFPAGAWSVSESVSVLTIDPRAYNGLKDGESREITVSYAITDGRATTQNSFVVTIAGKNDAPTGSASAALPDGTEDEAYTVSLADLLAGFEDVDGDMLSVPRSQHHAAQSPGN